MTANTQEKIHIEPYIDGSPSQDLYAIATKVQEQYKEGSITVETDFEWLAVISDVKAKLEEITNLPANWDGYGADQIQKEVAENSMRLLARLPKKTLIKLDCNNIVPGANGCISVEWENDLGESITLDIGAESASLYAKLKDESKIMNGNLSFEKNNFDSLFYAIDKYFND